MARTLTTIQDWKNAAVMGKQFGDPTRLAILNILADAGKVGANVTAICRMLKIRQPTVSHHLGLLRAARLVTPTRKGKSVIYSLADNPKRSEAVRAILGWLPMAAW